jgi:low temperature requirement protein LtrA
MAGNVRRGLRPVPEQTSVTTAELFFDVVFVFAFIQVTTLMTAENSVLGVVQGLLVLALLWWSWSLFAWLGNRVRADYGLSRSVVLAVTPVMFVLAVSIREAFQDVAGRVHIALWFVACFVVVRLLYLLLRMYATPGLGGRDIVVLTVPMATGAGLLLAAALLPHSALPPERVRLGQIVLWALAVAIDYALTMALRSPSRAVFSAAHWAERHNLIIIVALGEILVSVGVAGSDIPNSTGLFVASALAVVVAGALEWIYFDLSALAGEHALRAADPARRVVLARDGYTYLHLPMIAGIIFLAVGLKHTPALVGGAQANSHGGRLDDLGRYAMYGGVALFLLAHAAFQWRLGSVTRTVVWPRIVAAVLLLALLPVTARVSALRALGCLAAVCLVTAVTEFFVSRGTRRWLRQALLEEAAPAAGRDRENDFGSSPH